MRKLLAAVLMTATTFSLQATDSVGNSGFALGRQHLAKAGVSVGIVTPLANSFATNTATPQATRGDHETLARAGQPCRRFHPNKHFENFAQINFDESKEQSIARTLGPSPDDQVAFASDPILLENGALDAYPVTNGEYQAFIQDTGHPSPDHWEGGRAPEGLEGAPVVNVSHNDAQAFAQWSGKRLPTDQEWMSAQDQMSWDLEMPNNEWLAAPSEEEDAMILNRRDGRIQNVNRSLEAADTTFRLVSPSTR